ncbi:hypothetical protein FALBO_12132 [Fusarium albosuccineum]|uniref:Thioesterase-like superfamily-domain-containing protein n=1 Tax=Fusarium albosuccineum TaxID=1237068 RepID=A0A8H4L0Z7_9HYPO|nr:hypothetical protein FALBO_12132 [Fusarium albosuccineum]
MATLFKQQADLKQTGSHSYTASHHGDWAMGPTIFGGCIVGVVHLAASTHFRTTLQKYDQPDVLTLHLEFLRYSTLESFDITVTDLKEGGVHCTIQLQLTQGGQLKAIALATSINFDKPVGPTVATDWALNPPPPTPAPNFAKVLANEPDENWIPGSVNGEVAPLTRHILALNARGGFQIAGIADAWNCFTAEPMDATCIALMCDLIPSMSDTLLRNGGLYDAHKNFATMEEWAEKNPGQVCPLTNTLAEAAGAEVFNNTVSLDVEFKKKIPEEGIKWTFTRAATKQLQGGRMDLDVTICDEQMELVCLGRQVILCLDARKRFKGKKKASNL